MLRVQLAGRKRSRFIGGLLASRRRSGVRLPVELAVPASSARRSTSSSAAVGYRSSGDFCRSRAISASSPGGILTFSFDTESGVRLRISSNVTARVRPPNGVRPVAISKNRTPSENRSLRESTSSPRACSGDMYFIVPRTVPVAVWASSAYSAVGACQSPGSSCRSRTSLASPKSRMRA